MISLNPIQVEVPIDIDESKLDHALLDSELRGLPGFDGLTTREHKTVAHFVLQVDDATKQEIVAALDGYQKRLGGAFSREADIEYLKTRYSEDVVKLITEGEPVEYVNTLIAGLLAATVVPNESIDERSKKVIAAKLDPQVVAISTAYEEWQKRQNPFDIRLTILKDLQEKLGPEITDLHINGSTGDAFVSMTGKVPEDIVKRLHEIVAKHDYTKAPPPPKTEAEQLNDRLTAVENAVPQILDLLQKLVDQKGLKK